MDNLKNLEQTIEQHIDPNGAPGSILALNHQSILKTLLAMSGKYTGSVFTAQKNATVFPSGTFSWNGNAMNNVADFVITTAKKSADLNDIGLILETMVLGDIIQFKDYNGRAVFLIYQSHASGTDGGGNPTWNITVKGLAENPNYIYQDAESAIAVLSYHKKLVDATPAISTDAGNTAVIGTDGKILVPAMSISVQDINGVEQFKVVNAVRFDGVTFDSLTKTITAIGGGGTSTVQNRYSDIAGLLAGQGSQSDKAIQYVGDASTDPTVDSGFAYYEYLGTTAGTLADYRKLSEQESMDLIQSDAGLPNQNTFATINDLFANQGIQTTDFYQFVTDATTDPTVNSGWAIYQKLGTSTGTLSDYRKIMEQESMDVGVIQDEQVSEKTVNFTLTNADHGKFFRITGEVNVVITVPMGLAMNFKAIFKRAGTGNVTVVGDTGVVIETPAGYLAECAQQFDAIEIKKEAQDGTNDFIGVFGGLKPN